MRTLCLARARGAPGNFDDHDDTNIFFSAATQTWVDMQVIFQNHTDMRHARRARRGASGSAPPAVGRKYCDNAGCLKRRVVTWRSSKDGVHWRASPHARARASPPRPLHR